MKAQRSLISLSFEEGSKPNRTQSQKKSIQNLEGLWMNLSEEINQIRKQLKSKVSRSQFVSNLSSKLSISELASLNLMGCSNKENVDRGNGEKMISILQRQVEELTSRLNEKKNEEDKEDNKVNIRMQEELQHQIEELKQQIADIKKSSRQFNLELQRISEHNTHRETIQSSRITQIQANLYKKANRSELDKLFTLNELLVIQIQQAKQKVEEYNKLNKTKDEKIMEEIHQIKANLIQDQDMKRVNETTYKQLQEQINRTSSEIDRILNILEMKQSQKQAYSLSAYSNYSRNMSQLLEKIQNMDMDHTLHIKQLSTRLNILQIKQNQMGKANKEVDHIKNDLEMIKCDIVNLYEKSTQVSVHIKEFCQSIVNQNRNKMEEKINEELNATCEQIMRKVIKMTEDLPLKHEIEDLITPLKDKNKQIAFLQMQQVKKIQFLDQKQGQLMDSLDEQIQKSEERLNVMSRDIEERVQRVLAQNLKQFIKIQEMKQIGKEINNKIESQINRVVEEQNKINEVLCSENIIAKWFWTSAAMKGGNLVAWDKQIINTLPQNFKWNKNQPQILISKSGYYRIQMGFYSKKKPTVQLIVNGQTIVSAVNSNSYVLHHSSGKLKDVSNSQIAGLTYVDFLLLPNNAKIAISYIGEFTGEGFFSVQRI